MIEKFYSIQYIKSLFAICLSVFFLSSCEKEEPLYTRVSAGNSSESVTDGIVTVENSIMPPSTQQRFITAGQTSKALFQVISSRRIVIEEVYFKASYPAITYVSCENIGAAGNQNGYVNFVGLGELLPGEVLNLPLEIFYKDTFDSTSDGVAKLKFAGLSYRTDDGIYHNFFPKTNIQAQPMFLLHNIPHILFKDPVDDELQNGYKQIAQVELSGDTAWQLNTLPLYIYAAIIGDMPSSKILVQYQNREIETTSTCVDMIDKSNTQTVIHFSRNFKHIAGNKEVLGIYAKPREIGIGGNPLITSMTPLDSLVWADGSGRRIGGNKNKLYFKEETGIAAYNQK